MRISRRAGGAAAAVTLAVAVAGWRYVNRVPVPPPPALTFAPDADPALVADTAAARAAVEAAPRSAAAWGEYGTVLRAYELYDDAAACFRTAAALDPDDGRWAYLAGDRLAATDPAAAAVWLQKAVDADLPADAAEPARLALVEALLAADQPAAARAALGDPPPKSPRARLAAARIAAATGDDAGALALLGELARDPQATRPVFALQAQLYQRQGRPATAAEVARKAAVAPDGAWPDPLADPIPRRNNSRAGRLDEAARLLRLRRRDAAEEAVRVLQPLTAASPDAKPFLGLAEARAALGDRAGAARALDAGAAADPRDAAVHYQRGFLAFEEGERLWQAGQQEPARAAFRDAAGRFDAALALNPTFGKALLLKGVALQRFLGRPADGIALIRRFVELRPDAPDGHLLLGQALAEQRQLPAAREALLRAVELSRPGDRRAADALADVNRDSPGSRP